MASSDCPKCGYSPAIDVPRIPFHSSRVKTLLSTNQGLTEDEERDFKSFIANGSSKLSRLDARIELVKNLLEDLESARAELDLALTERKKILHPMRSMPTDLLVEIFKHGSGLYDDPKDLFRSNWHSLDITSSPWVYGHVCQRWQDISTRSPKLWTRVKIIQPERLKKAAKLSHKKKKVVDDDPRSSVLSSFVLPALCLYLGRSRTLPLTVYFDITSGSPLSNNLIQEHWYQAISAVTLSHSRRWESLSLGPGENLASAMFSSDSFELLRDLTSEEDSSGLTVRSFTAATQLTSWTTIGDPLSGLIRTSLSTTSFNHIQDYSSNRTLYHEVLRIVQLLPSLRRLSVQDLRGPLGLFSFSSPLPSLIHLPNLRELRIKQTTTWVGNGPSLFLDTLVCSSLRSLSEIASGLSDSTIREFQQRSGFTLKYWELTFPPISMVDGILDTTALETIVARDTSTEIQNLILSQLTVPAQKSDSNSATSSLASSTIPCPKLRRLELYLPSSHGLAQWDIMEQVFECIDSRIFAAPADSSSENNLITPLEVRLTAPDAYAMDMLRHPRLEELRTLGVRMEIVGV